MAVLSIMAKGSAVVGRIELPIGTDGDLKFQLKHPSYLVCSTCRMRPAELGEAVHSSIISSSEPRSAHMDRKCISSAITVFHTSLYAIPAVSYRARHFPSS